MLDLDPRMNRQCKFLLSILVFFGLSTGCKTNVLSPEAYKGGQIHFGSGGGFTGDVKTYSLLENGQIFGKTSRGGDSWSALPRTSIKEAKLLFQQYNDKKFAELQHDNPGNIYKFITFKSNDLEHVICWGGNKKKINEAVELYYRSLIELVKHTTP